MFIKVSHSGIERLVNLNHIVEIEPTPEGGTRLTFSINGDGDYWYNVDEPYSQVVAKVHEAGGLNV